MVLLPHLLFTVIQAPAPSAHPERPAVEVPLRAYFNYHQTGDPTGLAEAFHPDALLQWAQEGQRRTLGQAAWQRSAADKRAKAGGAPQPNVICEIAWIEVAGDAAVAKVLLDYPTFRFIDYMHLLKLKEGWKIVDKIYHREEHPR